MTKKAVGRRRTTRSTKKVERGALGAARGTRRDKKKTQAERTVPAARSTPSGRAREGGGPRRPSKGRSAPPAEVVARLARAIPEPHVELTFRNPWQLLIAVILSAQSTDRRVNLVTPALFARWPTPEALAGAPVGEVEEMIRSTGFFRNKTKAIRGASQMLVDRFDGEVPRSMQEMLQIPGVARKTANVVLGSAYGMSFGIVTDTHAMRVAQRLGLTKETTPEKIEADLCRQFHRDTWTRMGHRLVLHGRHVCTARAPRCKDCPLNEICPSRLQEPQGPWEERALAEAEDMAERAGEFRQGTEA